mmetsp:Transcript_2184/g.6533  ORF Transcript_2184/g.6533 Transcript_2184/m.6533 type:complete len:219 (+) Transcript_2184:1775-2431(+)
MEDAAALLAVVGERPRLERDRGARVVDADHHAAIFDGVDHRCARLLVAPARREREACAPGARVRKFGRAHEKAAFGARQLETAHIRAAVHPRRGAQPIVDEPQPQLGSHSGRHRLECLVCERRQRPRWSRTTRLHPKDAERPVKGANELDGKMWHLLCGPLPRDLRDDRAGAVGAHLSNDADATSFELDAISRLAAWMEAAHSHAARGAAVVDRAARG